MKMNVECLLRDSMKTKPKSNRGARQKTRFRYVSLATVLLILRSTSQIHL